MYRIIGKNPSTELQDVIEYVTTNVCAIETAVEIAKLMLTYGCGEVTISTLYPELDTTND